VSAIHSPFTLLRDFPKPEAHRGKFSGTEVKLYRSCRRIHCAILPWY
jgi:hypothetical protein